MCHVIQVEIFFFTVEKHNSGQEFKSSAGAVAHACNASTLGGQVRGITLGQELDTNLASMTKPHLY